ncbi:MAG: transglutaminase domain-containing protein [Anaerolineales bacterium]|nr:transglutaminase domain-containing protein [Anaerolineales bacterium]
MKKLFTLRSLFSLTLLLIAASAFVSGLKESVLNVQYAAVFPVAAFAVTLSYIFGFSTWSARRVWSIVLITGFIVAFIESARLVEPIKIIIQSIPQLELGLIRWVFYEEVPDISIFQTQLNEIITASNALISRLLNTAIEHPSVREFLWDIPLLLLVTWTGWGTSRRNQPLPALAPSLAFHAFILNYTGKDTLSLQIAVFVLILLIGINQKWNISQQKTENSERAARETYSAVIVLSIALAIIAGITPSISIEEIAQKLTSKDEIAKAIGLEREIAQSYSVSGLPRQHLIGLSPNLSQTVVFTVKTGELAPTENAIINEAVPRHYWRWLTYDIYNGQGWATSPVKNASYTGNEALIPSSSEKYQVIHQQVEKAFTQDSRLYWTGSLASAAQPFNASWRISPESLSLSIDPFLGADMLGAITDEQIYQADSLLPTVSANQLRESSQVYPQEIDTRYLSLPETVPPRVLDLAQEITVNIANPYDKAKAIENYLRNYPYSLDVASPPPNQDVADYFLFDLRTGYCDYYATSMIVLARAVGLPTRLVIGYASGIYDPTTAEYTVHEADAHSWVEIYFTGVGWVEFEPTASQLQFAIPDNLPEESISSLRPFPIATEGGANGYALERNFAQTEFFPIAVGVFFIILFFSLWFLHRQGLLKSHKTISSIYDYIFYHGKKIYKDAPLHETPSLFADKLRKQLRTGYPLLIPAPEEIKLLTDLYIQETFSAHPITKDERMNAIKVWRKLFWRLLYARFVRL